MSLQERLLERTPLSFHDWMAACLYDPDEGYYTKRRAAPRTGAGEDADFATSPTLHPFFAHCVANEIHAAYLALDAPEDFVVVEYGGGLGDLARDASTYLQDTHGWSPAWHHVEISPDHQAAQAAAGQDAPIATAPPKRFTGMVIAHEFLDALPVHLVERRMGHWAEMIVGPDGALMTGMPTKAGNDAAPAVDVPDGHRVVANAAAKAWFGDVAKRMREGRILVVDYGDESRRLWGRDPEWGTVRTFRQHKDGGSPLENAGEKDITASLDFTQCRQWANAQGLDEVSYESQEAFLLRHGVLDAINAADRTTQEGASAYLRLRQLMLPTGLGHAFKVAVYEKGMG